MDLQYLIPLPPKYAIEYFEKKASLESWRYEEIWQENHAKAFTVAKSTNMNILTDIQTGLNDALKEGKTFEQFKKDLVPDLTKKGWLPKIDDTIDPDDDKDVKKATARRLDTIYHTNMNTAYSAGTYKSLVESSAIMPYWKYVAIKDGRTRTSHLALDGLIFHQKHPFWGTHFPPNGWGCRCDVVAVTNREALQSDKRVELSEGETVWEDVVISTNTGELKERAVFKYKDPNKNIDISVATDPSWSYNVGEVSFAPDFIKYDTNLYKQYRTDTYLNQFSYTEAKNRIKAVQKAENAGLIYDTATGKKKGDKSEKKYFSCGVLKNDIMDKLGSKTKTVSVSEETLIPHIIDHPEITKEDYLNLQNHLDDSGKIYKRSVNKYAFIDEKTMKIAFVKYTLNRELFLISYRNTTKRDIKRIVKSSIGELK